jgi:hypothetical protein
MTEAVFKIISKISDTSLNPKNETISGKNHSKPDSSLGFKLGIDTVSNLVF